jgi:branched-chain amino acid transport system ATP-binding protein
LSTTSALLSIEDLCVSFGNVRAVSNLTMHVSRGAMVGLIGANGAGKTTTLDAVTGFVAAQGRATFNGASLLDQPAHQRARAGLVRTWQSLELFDDLTVRENLLVAASPGRSRRRRASTADQPDRFEKLLISLDLVDCLAKLPTELSQGQRKLLGLARGLAMEPLMLMADEPAAGLDSAESMRLGRRLRDLCEAGLTILLVDHDMGLVLGTCDYVYVLDHGVLIAQGTPAEIRHNPIVIDAYLGSGDDDPANPRPDLAEAEGGIG